MNYRTEIRVWLMASAFVVVVSYVIGTVMM